MVTLNVKPDQNSNQWMWYYDGEAPREYYDKKTEAVAAVRREAHKNFQRQREEVRRGKYETVEPVMINIGYRGKTKDRTITVKP